MTREERAQELNTIRQTDPVRLIATYRAATQMPLMDQMPRGLGFTGMIEAILAHEFPPEALSGDAQQAAAAAGRRSFPPEMTRPTVKWVPQPRRRPRPREFNAFCSGAAMVCTGLLMAALYVLVTHQIQV